MLPRASADARCIARYIADRSLPGASAWLVALEQARDRLQLNPLGCALAEENEFFDIDVRQALFKTRRGRVYRLVFTVVENEVRVLRVRGPGQAPLEPGDV